MSKRVLWIKKINFARTWDRTKDLSITSAALYH